MSRATSRARESDAGPRHLPVHVCFIGIATVPAPNTNLPTCARWLPPDRRHWWIYPHDYVPRQLTTPVPLSLLQRVQRGRRPIEK